LSRGGNKTNKISYLEWYKRANKMNWLVCI